jgi:hypothetical protein
MTKLDTTIKHNRLIIGQFGDIFFANWGIECSDRHSFVTLTDTPRNASVKNGIWHLAGGRLKIDLQTAQTAPDQLAIRARFTALDPITLQDAVIRLVFNKDGIEHGIIAGQTFRHTNSDKYRLHPVKQAELISHSGHRATINLTGSDGAGRFAPYLYLRDRDDHWIIHARLLPMDRVDQVWLRWANRLFTLSAPDGLARWLWNIGPARRTLWRLRERLGRHCPEIQAVPLNRIEPGQSLSLEVTCHFH